MSRWDNLAPAAILAAGAQALEGCAKLYKGAYQGTRGDGATGACLLGAVGLGLGLKWVGDDPDDLPPWLDDPASYAWSSLAVALGHLADECRRHLDHHAQVELMSRIGVGPNDDPNDSTPGDAFDRACIAAHSDGRRTSKNGAVKALKNAQKNAKKVR